MNAIATFDTDAHLQPDGLLLSVEAIASIAKSTKSTLAKSLAKKFSIVGSDAPDEEDLLTLSHDDLRELAVLAILGRDDPEDQKVARLISWVNNPSMSTIFEIALASVKREPKKTKVVYTYIIKKRTTKKIKIGKSSNVNERISVLQTASGENLDVLAVIPENIETQLHNRFAKYRGIGEWFNDSDGVIEEFAKSHSTECNTAARRVRSIL